MHDKIGENESKQGISTGFIYAEPNRFFFITANTKNLINRYLSDQSHIKKSIDIKCGITYIRKIEKDNRRERINVNYVATTG